jgi:hypothetical protein
MGKPEKLPCVSIVKLPPLIPPWKWGKLEKLFPYVSIGVGNKLKISIS